MEPPRGLWASLWNFIRFLPFFLGLLILGFIKGLIMFPVIFLLMTAGISGIILGLWPIHCFYTYYCVLSTKQFGPCLKLILCICIPVILIAWPPVGIACGVLGGAAYGLLAPMFATFRAVEEGRTDKFYHCICDGTWSAVKESFTILRDFLDVCYYSTSQLWVIYGVKGQTENIMRLGLLLYVPLALIAGILGSMIDLPMISIIALCLAILLWPLAVVGAVLGTMVSSIFLGAYAAVIVYQLSHDGTNMAAMPICGCRPRYTKKAPSRTNSSNHSASFSRPSSFKNPPSRTNSINAPMLELKPLELADALFKECQRHGEVMVSEGIITLKDIEDAKNNKSSGRVISIGLPAYCLLQALLRSAKANSTGILLSDNVTEITSSNRPKDTFFDWFLNPLLIIKDQIIADNLSETEEDYLGKLVLLGGDPARLKNLDIGPAPASELRKAELDALARRLQGITKSISRYPTFKRRFDSSMKNILDELAKEDGGSGKSSSNGPQTVPKSRSMLERLFSQKSLRGRTSDHGYDADTQTPFERDIEAR
ncbi:UNVERIFIED_CONTAM: putative membrane protein [Sesamum radiatum]|uniref:Membrane protein n=1 Tax=Sesamum radiatum TaxID=300843 RepID=A0AAW2VUS4_SESRA